MKKILLILIIAINFVNANSQDTDIMIVGDVVSNKEHVPFVNVYVKGTQIGTATNTSGHFMLNNLPVGEITIVAQALGYKKQEKTITTQIDKTYELYFDLKSDVLLTEQVIVSADKNDISRKDAAVIVSVLSPKVFEAVEATAVSDGLNFQPGLRLENNCQNCGFTQLRMNGLEGQYSQILIDSRAVFSSLSGVYGLEQIPVSMVERIEVIRGGGSALFGGNAIAGTVNIITKEPIMNTYSVYAKTSFLDLKTPDKSINFNTSLVSDNRKSGIFLFGMIRDRAPYNANENETWVNEKGETVNDDFSEIAKLKSGSFGFRAYYKPTIMSKISLDFHNIVENRRGGNKFESLPHETDITEEVKHNIIGSGLTYDLYSKNRLNKYSMFVSSQYTDRDSYYGAAKSLSAYGKTKDLSFIGGSQYSRFFDKLLFAPADIILGVENKIYKLEDTKLGYTQQVFDTSSNTIANQVYDNMTIVNQQINVFGSYAQIEWKSEKVKLLSGVRVDKHQLLENAVIVPRANLLYKLNESSQFRISYAKGYRAPQIFSEDLHIEIAGAKGVHHYNSSDLTQESSNSFSGSYDWTKEIKKLQFYALIEGFYTELINPFVNEMTINDNDIIVMERRNGSGAMVYGTNVEFKFSPFEKLDFQLGGTLQKGRYVDKEVIWEAESNNPDSLVATNYFLKSPDKYGYMVLNYDFTKKFKASVSGTYTGEMLVPHMIDGNTGYTILETTPEFFDMGVRFSYTSKISEDFKMQFVIGMQNIFNSYQNDFDAGIYRDAGYVYGPLSPRTITFGVKFGSFL